MYSQEDLRILAGLQESRNVENPLHAYREQQKLLLEEQNRKKEKVLITIADNFEKVLHDVKTMERLIVKARETLESGILQEKIISKKDRNTYDFFEALINEDIVRAITILLDNSKSIETFLTETQEEHIIREFDQEYFVFSDISAEMFKDKLCESRVGNTIESGTILTRISEELAMVKGGNKKRYIKVNNTFFEEHLSKGHLIR